MNSNELPDGIRARPFFAPFVGELASPEELRELRAINEELAEIDARRCRYSPQGAYAAKDQAQLAAHRNPSPANLAAAESLGSIFELQTKYRESSQALDAVRTVICQERLLPACYAILERVVAIALREQATLQASEEELSRKLGIPYKRSAALNYMETRIVGAKHYLTNGIYGNPTASTILDWAFDFGITPPPQPAAASPTPAPAGPVDAGEPEQPISVPKTLRHREETGRGRRAAS